MFDVWYPIGIFESGHLLLKQRKDENLSKTIESVQSGKKNIAKEFKTYIDNLSYKRISML